MICGVGLALALVLLLAPEEHLTSLLLPIASRRSSDGVITAEGIALLVGAARLAGRVGALGALVLAGAIALIRPRPRDLLYRPDRSAPPPRRPASWEWIAVLLGTGAVTALSVRGIGDSLWYDEAFTALRFVRPENPFFAFTHYETLNNHPLYSAVASLTVRWLGPGETGLRLPALIGSVLTGPVVFMAATETGSRTTAFVAFVLAITSAPAMAVGTQARGYGMALFFGAVSILLFVRMVRSPSSWTRLTWAGCAVLGTLTHLGFLLLVFLEAGALLAWARHDPRETSAVCCTMAIVSTGIAIGYLGIAASLVFELSSFSHGRSGMVPAATWAMAGVERAPWVGLLVLALAFYVLVAGRPRERMPVLQVLAGLTLVALVAVSVAGAGQARFYAPLLPAVWISLAIALTRGLRGVLPRIGRVALVGCLALGIVVGHRALARRPPNGLRSVSTLLRLQAGAGRCMVLDWAVADPLPFYAPELEWRTDVGQCPPGSEVLIACQECRGMPPATTPLLAEIPDRHLRPFRVYRMDRPGP